MAQQPHNGDGAGRPVVLTTAPEELTRGRLQRIGEGIGNVVYASERWVVKRKRRPSETLTLILMWRTARRLDRLLPFGLGRALLLQPARRLRLMRLVFHAIVLAAPRSIWYTAHLADAWRIYVKREWRGEILAASALAGTSLVPEHIAFPPTRVKVGSWPGWLIASDAVERVETTLCDRINELARARRFDEIELWLERLLDLRQAGWRHGVFSLDAHLKNYGVTGSRVVLLDPGGLTDDWSEIERRLGWEGEVESPHVRLGLEMTLRDRPDIAERFDARWRSIVNRETVSRNWSAEARKGPVVRRPGSQSLPAR